ncbi:helix-turn-helix domain-containing protein [Bremerella sp. T1]|nr:helix-turn-helix domain-containing protein [Bremerella volcania]
MAKALGICPRLLHNWEKHEGLPVVRIRGSIRYSPDAVRTWIAERTTRAIESPKSE